MAEPFADCNREMAGFTALTGGEDGLPARPWRRGLPKNTGEQAVRLGQPSSAAPSRPPPRTDASLKAACEERFGPARVPSIQALHRFVQSTARGERPQAQRRRA